MGTLVGEEALKVGLPDLAIKLQEAQLNLNYLQMKFQHKIPVTYFGTSIYFKKNSLFI